MGDWGRMFGLGGDKKTIQIDGQIILKSQFKPIARLKDTRREQKLNDIDQEYAQWQRSEETEEGWG